MKKVYSILSILLSIALIGTLVSCEKDQEVMLTAVSVTNEQITPMYNSATISSTISSEATIREVFVQYARTKDFAEYDEVSMQEIDGRYTAELLDLQDNTIYYYRYAASNRHSAIVLKTIHQFETLKPTVPTISLDTILTVWDSYAQVQITLSFDGGANVSEMGVCWGTNPEPTPENNALQTKDTVAVLNISSLEPNTQYYVRAYATNKIGVGYSQTYTFTTFAMPQVQSNDITDVQLTSAMLNGLLLSDGNDTAVVVGFCWSENEEPTISDTLQIVEIKDNIFSYYLSSLKDETQYFVRAFAQNRIGVAYGETKAFTTASTVIPTVLTTAATQVTTNSAVVGGNVTDDGGAEVTERGIVYSTTPNPTTANSKLTSGSGVGEFTCDLTDLQSNATYYARAYAINKKGVAYGEEVSFATNKQIILPSITTNAITQITETSAVAGGNVTSDGNASVTERGVVYSTNPNPVITNLYNTIKPCGSGTGSFTCELTNLQPNTTYYVRAYATNEKGTAYGEEVSFTTNKNIVLPSLITNIITQITETTAVAGGNVTSDGNASVTERGVVYSTNPNPVITNLYNTIKPCGSGTGSFTCDLTNLQPNTTYYVRAYATNSMGTAYGEEVSFTTEKDETVVSDPTGTENGYGYVDLGLPSGLMWATMNVGAETSEAKGNSYAWGEVEPKSSSNWSTYLWCNGTSTTLTKYNSDSNSGVVDEKWVLEPEDDAATVNWGGKWRMPTKTECEELKSNCHYEAYVLNGYSGMKFTSKTNGNSIFICSSVWTNTLSSSSRAYPMIIGSSYVDIGGVYTVARYELYNIRPVFSSQANTAKPTIITNIVTQITETTAVAGGNVTSDGNASVTERGVVYSTNPNPVITNLYNTIKPCGSGTGSFTCDLTNLQPNTTYYVRAYAVNSVGTAYGEEISFTTEEEVVAIPEYVDLGLSVKWATFNVGASKPEEYGDYFAWGETEPKSEYSWSTYKWCNGYETALIKYNTDEWYGIVDNKIITESEDDAATIYWGDDWRLPNKYEIDELRDKCTWSWINRNGTYGYKVTGPSGKSIFLPTTRYMDGIELSGVNAYGSYWSSSLNTPSTAWHIGFYSDYGNTYADKRYTGRAVRPVYGPRVEEVTALPTVITHAVTALESDYALIMYEILDDGGSNITDAGVVYGLSSNPTILNNKVSFEKHLNDKFECDLYDLQPNTTYFVRAYATNSMGTAYGEELSFTTEKGLATNPPSNLTAMPFSVSESKQVYFSKGNLQYHPANNEWRFAESQLDYIGDAKIYSTYHYGWLDLFGWSGSTASAKFGVNTSTDNNDYSGNFVDWGTNQIGADAPNTWRTLTKEEWNYLLNTRTNASSLCGIAQVKGVNGLIILPDNWTCPGGVTFNSGFYSSYPGVDGYAAYQTFTAEQWSEMEATGAVFLPAAGYCYGSQPNSVQFIGNYWSATERNSGYADCFSFTSDGANMGSSNRYLGQSVRLVKD